MKNRSTTCKLDDCDRRVRARGWCNTHYLRWKRHGDPHVGGRPVYDDTCSVEGCDDPHMSRSWCSMHYQRWQTHGDPTYEWKPEPCAIEGCNEPHYGRGWCREHHRNWARRGDPTSPPTEWLETCTVDDCNEPHYSAGWCRKHSWRWVKYGVTPAQYEAALKDGCHICGEVVDKLHVDHDHDCCLIGPTCGQCTRGFLCRGCNQGLGHFRDNVDALTRAIQYLQRQEKAS